MYYSTARFEELKELELRQISIKGASIEIQICNGKQNQTRKLQRCIIHPNSLEYKGKMCPVKLIVCYLSLPHKLGHNSDNDYLFPNVCAKFRKPMQTHDIVIQIPKDSMSYNNYRGILKKHLEDKTLKDMGVSVTYYSTHSFQREGLSILADVEMHPSYIKNNAQHKCWELSVT